MEFTTLNILLVEDDPIDQEHFKRALVGNEIEHNLFLSSSAEDALALLRNPESPSRIVVVLDLTLKGRDGFSFLDDLRADPKLASKIVFVLTSSEDHSNRLKALDYNVAGYFVKPEASSEFLKLVSLMNSFLRINEFL